LGNAARGKSAGHARVVQAIGVGLGHGIQKLRVLPRRYIVLADAVGVVHLPLACRIATVGRRVGRVARIAHRHGLDADLCPSRAREQQQRGENRDRAMPNEETQSLAPRAIGIRNGVHLFLSGMLPLPPGSSTTPT